MCKYQVSVQYGQMVHKEISNFITSDALSDVESIKRHGDFL
jgi:hypothetical protein